MIRIPESALSAITAAAEAAYPEECCGLLVGRDDDAGNVVVTGAMASDNVFEGDRRRNFLVDPKVQFDLMRAVGDGPDRIVGNYHSHPDGPAAPSAHDVDSVFYPEHLWLIVAVEAGRAGDVTAHRFDEAAGRFRKITLAPIGDPARNDE